MKSLIIRLLAVFALLAVYLLGSQCEQKNRETKWEKTNAVPYEDSSFLDYNKKMGGIISDSPSGKYSIVVGAFRHEKYAKKKVDLCIQSGYTPEIVKFRNGIMAVILCPTDDLDTALSYMEELKSKGLCPADGWILTDERSQ